jgi:hypothetical protein
VAEYVNPKYATAVRALREAQQQAARRSATVPVRGFITTPQASK